jgi:hypothetical protein
MLFRRFILSDVPKKGLIGQKLLAFWARKRWLSFYREFFISCRCQSFFCPNFAAQKLPFGISLNSKTHPTHVQRPKTAV